VNRVKIQLSSTFSVFVNGVWMLEEALTTDLGFRNGSALLCVTLFSGMGVHSSVSPRLITNEIFVHC